LWLLHHRFFERTGIAPHNLRFCLQRPQKADHCVELGLTHFIDDRPDVLQCMRDVVPHRYLFGPQKKPFAAAGVVSVPAWSDAMAPIAASFQR
jgi:hypothetical protein